MCLKDYFYFQKRDRLAILLLLILIVLSGIIYILTKPAPKAEDNLTETQEASFINTKKENTKTANRKIQNTQKPLAYSYQEKLKTGETIELNSADTTALKKIPGIGTAYASRIVKYRNLLGGYADITQLQEVWGIDEGLYNKITPYLTIEPKTNTIRINHLSIKELMRHPYIDYKQAKAIADIRERKGKIESVNRLSLLDEFCEEDIKRLNPYLSFD
ncbi:helix-hairpin-helix domain-containing protein [Prevotella sp. 10(H)]|uniref:helix-hairpin-helix domain-containing protein n=1 Tax=Prevotella sp. 10(H) TaxID=1158294 RepID=UPI0004A74968|nr:helix-hairpin-helix domain-containing protein [Prevotella sp. 10(H)]